jgi:TetR/AcrR family transcriptional repressor of mexAB-oprM operon
VNNGKRGGDTMLIRKERKDALEHRRIILQKAQSLFTEYGVDSVTMHQIAKSAGIGQGTLYRRYAHKGEICQDLMKESCEGISEEIIAFLKTNKLLPIRERLNTALQLCLDFIDSQSHWLVSIQAPTCEGRQELMYQSPMYKFLHDLFYELISEAEASFKEAAKDAIFRADTLIASMNPELYLFMRRERGYTKDEIKHKLVSLYIDPLFL